MFSLPESRDAIVEFGKTHYETIGRFREALEDIVAEDMRDLYDVKRFLKSKKVEPSPLKLVHLHRPSTLGRSK